MGTDLDKVIDDIYQSGNADGFSGYGQDTKMIEKYKQQILDWHNKQIEAVLDRLDKSMPTDEQLITKYGYHMPEKKHGYRLGLHDIRETIEAERNKLKESK